MQDVVGRPGHADFEENAVTSRPYRKVATVFEDPSIRASDAKIDSRFTHELVICGTGFNRVAEPILGFDPPLDPAAVNVHVSGARGVRKLWLRRARCLQPRGARAWKTLVDMLCAVLFSR